MNYLLDSKIVFWLISLIFTFLSYFIYYKSIFKGKSKPHIFSWFIWGLISTIICIIQIYDNAWIWAINTWFVALLCLWIAFLSFKKWEKEITKVDKISLGVGLLSIILWIFTKDPLYSVLLLIGIDLFWFIPTFFKSYKKPYEENGNAYFLASLGYWFSILAMSHISFLTVGFIIFTFVSNLLLSILIFYRRQIKAKVIA